MSLTGDFLAKCLGCTRDGIGAVLAAEGELISGTYQC